MRKTKATALVLSIVLMLGGAGVVLPIAHARLPVAVEGEPLPSLAPVLERTTPAVVNIFTRSAIQVYENPLFDDPFFRRFFDIPEQPRKRYMQNLGSGVIVDAERGYIITNHHVTAKAEEISVTLRDGRKFNARLVGTDPDSDVAVLQIKAENLSDIPLGDSDKLRVGDFVLAIGNPFGLGQTVTSGIVSALGRSGLGIEGYEDFIQTDASINPGNSGGALVNLRGELIGINTAILSRSGGNIGIGFAIPINMAREIMSQIVQHGEVQRGRLGAQAQDLTPELAQAFGIRGQPQGAVVSHVIPGSPAEQAGLRVGDVVRSVNGRRVRSAGDLRNAIGLLRVGTKVTLKVLRDGRTLTLSAVVSSTEPTSYDAEELHPRLAGARFGPITEDSPLLGRVEGVMIYEVQPGSPAAGAGLRARDVITSINRREISTPEEALQAARRGGQRILLNLRRGDTALFLLIQ